MIQPGKPSSHIHILHLLTMLLVFSACNGQLKTDQLKTKKSSAAEIEKKLLDGQPKIVRTETTGWSESISSSMQDANGNIWFGTAGEGAYRYDGKSLTHFTTKDGLSHNNVGFIYEDRNHNLWFGTGNGLCRYDPSATIPFSVLQVRENEPYTRTIVTSMLQDRNGTFWIGTSQGMFCYDEKVFTPFLSNNQVINESNLNLEYITNILEDQNGYIWFSSYSQEGICCFDGKRITQFKPKNDGMVPSIYMDKNGDFWFGTKDHGACRYAYNAALNAVGILPSDGAVGITNFNEIATFNTSAVFCIREDKNGVIWFGTESGRNGEGSGAWCYDPAASASSQSNVFSNLTMKDGAGYNSVWTILEDKNGLLWFGTRNMGLFSWDGKVLTDHSE